MPPNSSKSSQTPRSTSPRPLYRIVDDCAPPAAIRPVIRLVSAVSGQPTSVARLEIERALFLAGGLTDELHQFGQQAAEARVDDTGHRSQATALIYAEACVTTLIAMGYQTRAQGAIQTSLRNFVRSQAAQGLAGAASVVVLERPPYVDHKPTLETIVVRGGTLLSARYQDPMPVRFDTINFLDYRDRRIRAMWSLVEGPAVREPQPADQGFMLECMTAAHMLAKRHGISLTFKRALSDGGVPFEGVMRMRTRQGVAEVRFWSGSADLLRHVRALAARHQTSEVRYEELMTKLGIGAQAGQEGDPLWALGQDDLSQAEEPEALQSEQSDGEAPLGAAGGGLAGTSHTALEDGSAGS